MNKKNCLLLAFFTISTLLSSCQTLNVRGHYIDDEDLKKLELKQLSKDQVLELVGSPNFVPEYDVNTWYYSQITTSQRAWFDPHVVNQRIVKLTFNKKNMLDELSVLNDTHNKEVNTVKEYTKTYGSDLNPIQKFIKNIGRFTKKDSKKKQHD